MTILEATDRCLRIAPPTRGVRYALSWFLLTIHCMRLHRAVYVRVGSDYHCCCDDCGYVPLVGR